MLIALFLLAHFDAEADCKLEKPPNVAQLLADADALLKKPLEDQPEDELQRLTQEAECANTFVEKIARHHILDGEKLFSNTMKVLEGVRINVDWSLARKAEAR